MTAGANVEPGKDRRRNVLRKASDFESVLRSGSRAAGKNFVVRAQPNTCAHARLGIIAGRKAAARAVDRNRGKRLIREVFRGASAALGAYDIAVQLRNDLRSEPNGALRAELSQLLQSAVRRTMREATPPNQRT